MVSIFTRQVLSFSFTLCYGPYGNRRELFRGSIHYVVKRWFKMGCIVSRTLMTIGGFRRRNIFYEIDILFCTESVTFGKVECQMCGHGMLPVGLWGRTTLNNMQLSNTMKIYHLNDTTFNESNYLLNWCPI